MPEERAVVRRVLVVSLPAMVILATEDNKISQQNFSVCDRVPQSQLVKVKDKRYRTS